MNAYGSLVQFLLVWSGTGWLVFFSVQIANAESREFVAAAAAVLCACDDCDKQKKSAYSEERIYLCTLSYQTRAHGTTSSNID